MHAKFELPLSIVTMLDQYFGNDILKYMFYFPESSITFHADYLKGRKFAYNVSAYFLEK